LKTLLRRQAPLAEPAEQVRVLEATGKESGSVPRFAAKLKESGLWPLVPTAIDTLQVNVGKMCNQTCRHCHVDAGPDRTEIMTPETMDVCVEVVRRNGIRTVDLTGGAPEMNPHFRPFVEKLREAGAHVIVRCNLTILLHGKAYEDLPQFFAKHRVQVVSSLPFYEAGSTDRQRGLGVFTKSIEALRRLNAVGYGDPESGLELDLVYNPVGAFLPAPQAALERDFKAKLKATYGIRFNRLFAITNLPVSRFLEFLLETEGLEAYLQKLAQAYNPVAAAGVMCRNLVSVGWDGQLYDCDFNQMLALPVTPTSHRHLRDFDKVVLERRAIVVGQHCYGCTAGQGSSCGGSTA
jgi:radical SAM/Cys-rich protein